MTNSTSSTPAWTSLVEGGVLTSDHADELAAAAIDPALVIPQGIRSITDPTHLPKAFSWCYEQAGGAMLPALLYTHVEPDGTEKYQIKPITGTVVDADGGPVKYVSEKARAPELPVVRPVDEPDVLLIVEGTKQALAAASWAPEQYAVYRITGCHGWSRDGVPTEHLHVVEDLDVVIVLDADAATNPRVYDGGTGLAEACKAEGAASVKFARLPGTGKAGLDDILAKRVPEKRTAWLARVVAGAKAKPADKRPARQKRARPAVLAAPITGSRPFIDVNDDRLAVIEQLTNALASGPHADRLFSFADRLCRVTEIDGTVQTEVVDRGVFENLVAAAAVTGTVRRSPDGTPSIQHSWPDRSTMDAVLARHRVFPRLVGISDTPILREDGTIATDPGYDEASGYYLATEGLDALDVPDQPTPEQVAAARELIRSEWLSDFPVITEGDRTNLAALALTAFVRELVGCVPLAVISATTAGTGKTLAASAVIQLVTGAPAAMDSLPGLEEERRKAITAQLRAGSRFLPWDETPEIGGKSVARLLTSRVWEDRLLGSTLTLRLPVRAIPLATGNNVEIRGDIFRRYYPIQMEYSGPDPENRPASDFRHPDLLAWTDRNRGRLLSAFFTIIRAWVVAGRPGPSMAFSFGSFESWQRVVGGILANAGFEGFLEGLTEHRSASDWDEGAWASHYNWLAAVLAEKATSSHNLAFTVRQVVTWMQADPIAETPPGLEDLATPGYPRALGKAYARRAGKWSGGRRIVRAGMAGGNQTRWVLQTAPSEPESSETTPGDPEPVVAEDAAPAIDEPRLDEGADPVTDGLPEFSEQCTGCGGEMELVPPARLWGGCRTCHPADFEQEVDA